MNRLDALPRLVYLADEHRIEVPTAIAALIPRGFFINKVARMGLDVAIINDDFNETAVRSFYEKGRKSQDGSPNRGSPDEFRALVGQLAVDRLEEDRSTTPLDAYLNRLAEVRDFVIYGGDVLVDTVDVPFTQDSEGVVKFEIGFPPFDRLTGGFYQGIVTVIGKPGHGKTTFMLAMLEGMRRTNLITSSIFLEVEIPASILLWKARPMKGRTTFTEQDRLFTGNYTTRQILRYIQENPDPNRAVFIDGPDAMTAGSMEKKHLAIEQIYRDLLRIKNQSKIVVVSSQPRRDEGILGMDSVANAWAKSQYSDIVLGIHKRAPVWGEGAETYQVMVNCSKNRFGRVGEEVTFTFDYFNLKAGGVTASADDWNLDLRSKEKEEDDVVYKKWK